MDPMFEPPSATAFDAVSSLASAGIYVIVALAALASAPRDTRARVFLATALASVAPYLLTAQIWASGFAAVFTRTTVVVVALSLMIGSLALFHFSQVFPWRRPWIRGHATQLWIGYLVIPVLVGLAVVLTPSFEPAQTGGFGVVTTTMLVIIAVIVVGIVLPTTIVLGVLVPLAGLLSLYKSFLVARKHQIESARMTTLLMLISQLGGGVLTILIVPLVRLAAPAGPWVTMAASALFAFAILMPVAFAYGVWKLDVLKLDIDALPQ